MTTSPHQYMLAQALPGLFYLFRTPLEPTFVGSQRSPFQRVRATHSHLSTHGLWILDLISTSPIHQFRTVEFHSHIIQFKQRHYPYSFPLDSTSRIRHCRNTNQLFKEVIKAFLREVVYVLIFFSNIFGLSRWQSPDPRFYFDSDTIYQTTTVKPIFLFGCIDGHWLVDSGDRVSDLD